VATFDRDEALDRYIERVRAIPTLSREEEHELAVQARAGDEEAAQALVEANLRYVVAVALQYRRYGVRLGDLVAEGSVGLMTAVRKFDPDRGTRFVTYAGYWIRAFVLESVVRSTSMVGGGTGPLRSKLFFRLRRERAKVEALTTDPGERLDLLADRFGVTRERMATMLARLESKDVSLDAPVFDDSSLSLVDTVVSDTPPQDLAYDERHRSLELEDDLAGALASLDRRERFIVEKRILHDEEMSLAALGRELGVSRERARQLEARAKHKLRKRLERFAPAA